MDVVQTCRETNVRVVDFVDIRHHNLSLIADLSSGRGDAHIDKVSSDNRDNLVKLIIGV